MSPDLIALFQVLRMQSLPISPGAKLTNYGLLKNVRSSLIADMNTLLIGHSGPERTRYTIDSSGQVYGPLQYLR